MEAPSINHLAHLWGSYSFATEVALLLSSFRLKGTVGGSKPWNPDKMIPGMVVATSGDPWTLVSPMEVEVSLLSFLQFTNTPRRFIRDPRFP